MPFGILVRLEINAQVSEASSYRRSKGRARFTHRTLHASLPVRILASPQAKAFRLAVRATNGQVSTSLNAVMKAQLIVLCR